MGSKEPIGDKPTPTVSSHEGRRSRVGRLRLPYLLGHYPARLVWAAFLFVNGFLTIGLLASFAMTSGTPLIFPSLGPTAFLLFRNPMQPAACPRNTLCGHAVGILCGYASLWLMGLTHDFPTIVEGVLAERVLCAALSPGRDRHPHGLAGHLASTGWRHHTHHRVGDHHSALPLVDCRSGSCDTGPSGTDHQQTGRHRVSCLGCRCS